MLKNPAISAALGAIAAALLVIAWYELREEPTEAVADDDGAATARAGVKKAKRIRPDRGAADRDVPAGADDEGDPREEGAARRSTRGEQGKPGHRKGTKGTIVGRSRAAEDMSISDCREALDESLDRLDTLERRAKLQSKQLSRYRQELEDERSYDLSSAKLQELASECMLRWDNPALELDGPPTVPKDIVDELGIAEKDALAANEVLADYYDEMMPQIAALYTEVTGDIQTDSIAPSAMLAEIDDKTPKEELQRIFQKLSAERAGLATPPAPGAEMSATERLYRLITAAGDKVEQAMAAKLDPETAHMIRDYRGGYASRRGSSYGCPEP